MDQLNDGKIPLGLCKQAVMKLESFMTDIQEIKEDPDVSSEDKENFEKMSEIAGFMAANIVNIISKECDETEFLNENVPMDEIDSYPGDDIDILDIPAE